jgi:hypothetical protein
MSDSRRSDPTVRRQVAVFLVVVTCVGALLIMGFERYRIPLRDWVLADLGPSAHRLKLVLVLLTALLLAPLLAVAAYLWSLAGKVIRARAFPPPGLRLIRDTPVITGASAIARGRLLQVLALGGGIASVVLGLLLWRLASLLSDKVYEPVGTSLRELQTSTSEDLKQLRIEKRVKSGIE